MTSDQPKGVWNANSKRWHNVGPPLRPSSQDGRMMLQLAGPSLNASSDAHIAVLGVTPEVVQLDWPAHARLSAFDMSADMIAKVWKPHPVLRSEVHNRRWQEIPLPDGVVACVAGDGSLNALQELGEFGAVLDEAARLLKPDGVMVLRVFVRPEMCADLNEVARAVSSGEIETFHALKWHVAMAIADAPDFSVRVADIRAAIIAMFPDRERLASLRGWPREAIDTIDSYEGADTRYNFPTFEALQSVCAPRFEIVDKLTGDYEIAERCPTILFRLR